MNRVILSLLFFIPSIYSYSQDVQKNQDELTIINQAIEKEPNNPVNYYNKAQYLSRGLEWDEVSSKPEVCSNYNTAFKLLSNLEEDNGALSKEQDEIYVFLLNVWNAGYCDFN